MNQTLLAAHDHAERALLGCFLINGKLYNSVTFGARIERGHFGSERHRLIFDAIGAVAARRVPPDLLLVEVELSRADNLAKAGGAGYLASLLDIVPDLDNVYEYARLVREGAIERRLARLEGK